MVADEEHSQKHSYSFPNSDRRERPLRSPSSSLALTASTNVGNKSVNETRLELASQPFDQAFACRYPSLAASAIGCGLSGRNLLQHIPNIDFKGRPSQIERQITVYRQAVDENSRDVHGGCKTLSSFSNSTSGKRTNRASFSAVRALPNSKATMPLAELASIKSPRELIPHS